jgi:hypothetical protein
MHVRDREVFEGHCEFAAKNISDRTIIINSVQTTCGCTIAKTSTFEVKSGEKVRISVDVKVDRGKYEPKTILVDTDESSGSPYRLQIDLSRNEDVIINPESLTVDTNSPRDKRTFKVFLKSSDITLIGVDSTDYRILPKIVSSQSPNEFFVEVSGHEPPSGLRVKIVLFFATTKLERWEESVFVETKGGDK